MSVMDKNSGLHRLLSDWKVQLVIGVLLVLLCHYAVRV